MTRRHKRPSLATRQASVRTAWETFVAAEPDISTERLMAMVAEETGEDYGDVAGLMEAAMAREKRHAPIVPPIDMMRQEADHDG